MAAACDIEAPHRLRPPAEAMRLSRLGAHFATRLSFSRVLTRDLAALNAIIDRPHHDLNDHGFGTVVYRIRAAGECYCLCCFATELDPDQRTDRVIAQAWDASFVLFDGEPTGDDLARLREQVPRQEAGRFTASEIVLSRANKSVRLFDHVVEALALGRQPDAQFVADIGYLMRTTAVYGNGKFGLADRITYASRRLLKGAFRPEMLSVFLIRLFTHELVEHIAAKRAPGRSVSLSAAAKRHLGIGNATGLGMAPFIVTHGQLFNNWMLVRETALARAIAGTVQSTPDVDNDEAGRRSVFARVLARLPEHLAQWRVDDERQVQRLALLSHELECLSGDLSTLWRSVAPWSAIHAWGRTRSLEMQELLVSVLIEAHGDRVDGLADCCDAHERMGLDPSACCGDLVAQMESQLAWALATNLGEPQAQALFWYVSAEKLEPRLGLRNEEPGADREMPIALVRDYQALHRALKQAEPKTALALWLADHPTWRHVVSRVQSLAAYPYAEIHDNLIDRSCLPVDLLRCKLAMFGASRFDPKSDRWTRITLFHGAPVADEIGRSQADDWSFAVVPATL